MWRRAGTTKHGSARTRAAAAHVTKVQGAAENYGILDTADISTDCGGDPANADAGKARPLASAFADFQAGRGEAGGNGLVTVYNADGDILRNGDH